MNRKKEHKNFNVYIYQNIINNKYYVGQTTNFKRREDNHKRFNGGCVYFCNAIKKHGWENFKLISLMEVNSKEEMDELEMLMIEDLGSCGKNGYNLCIDGGGQSGYKQTSEQIQKRVEKMLGRITSEETKQIQSETRKKGIENGTIIVWNKGLTKETDDRLKKLGEKGSIAKKGKPGHSSTEETNQKISIANSGEKNGMYGKPAWNRGISTPQEIIEKGKITRKKNRELKILSGEIIIKTKEIKSRKKPKNHSKESYKKGWETRRRKEKTQKITNLISINRLNTIEMYRI